MQNEEDLVKLIRKDETIVRKVQTSPFPSIGSNGLKRLESQTLLIIGRLRTLSSAVESRKFSVQEDTQRSVHVGCMIPLRYGDCRSVIGRHISRRGLLVLLIPAQGDARARQRDRRTVEAPTSLFFYCPLFGCSEAKKKG